MTYLLDTNACIKYLNGKSERIRQHLESKSTGDIVLCAEETEFLRETQFLSLPKGANYVICQRHF